MVFDYKVTCYCAAAPNKSLIDIASTVEAEETNFAIDEQTIDATTRHNSSQGSLKIIDFDVWLNPSAINPNNIDKILKHAILHGLGLRHSENPEALMCFPPRASQMRADDLAAIRLLYEICEEYVDDESYHFRHKVPLEEKTTTALCPMLKNDQ